MELLDCHRNSGAKMKSLRIVCVCRLLDTNLYESRDHGTTKVSGGYKTSNRAFLTIRGYIYIHIYTIFIDSPENKEFNWC